MDKIVIVGGKKLTGKVRISGSKNSALPILISTLLTNEKCIIGNVPELKDIDTAISLLSYLGKRIIRKKNTIEISSDEKMKKIKYVAPYELIKKMRASFLVSGPLLAKYGKAEISLPGGCAIGVRPVDIHIKGLRQLGAKVELKEGNVVLSCKKLVGNNVYLRYPSVGATENIMMVATLAKGRTIISNAACEPEIVDLADFLTKLGGKITGAGTKKITIYGVNGLAGSRHDVIPDRIEAGTYLIAGAITHGSIVVNNCRPEHLKIIISKLRQSGTKINYTSSSISLMPGKKIKSVSITTKPYSGFPTDLQAQWMTLMCVAGGKSVIRENVFENRFLHIGELQRLGARLHVKNSHAVVEGSSSLTGATVMVSDLRAGAALVLAGLVAKGKTTITHIYHLDRGYERLEHKFRNLGADIRRIGN